MTAQTIVSAQRHSPRMKRPIRSYAPLYPPHQSGRLTIDVDSDASSFFAASKPSPSDDRPEPWARALAGAILDAVEGRRDLRSLDRWITRELFTQLTKSCRPYQRTDQKPRRAQPYSTRAWYASNRVVEIAVTVWDQDRLRAVSMRLVRRNKGWIVAAVEYG